MSRLIAECNRIALQDELHQFECVAGDWVVIVCADGVIDTVSVMVSVMGNRIVFSDIARFRIEIHANMKREVGGKKRPARNAGRCEISNEAPIRIMVLGDAYGEDPPSGS